MHYNSNLNFEFDKIEPVTVEEVGECPLCHKATSPTFINGYLIGSSENAIPLTAYIILYCPSCRELYIATYRFYNGLDQSILIDCHPHNTLPVSFNDNLKLFSPEFVNIYAQAKSAESSSDTKGLAGIGYRKALEYLIKDYLIQIKKQDKKTIIQMDLGRCVNMLDAELQNIEKASVWLGNDETHYYKKNDGYDLNDLKEFIDCLVADIERECVRQKAKKLVNK